MYDVLILFIESLWQSKTGMRDYCHECLLEYSFMIQNK